MRNGLVVLLLSSLLLTLPVRGQQPQSPPPPKSPQKQSAPPLPPTPDGDQDEVVRITTSLVQLDAVVTKDGKKVTDLKPEDFEVFEDGKRQTITNFSYISNVPNATALAASLVDKTAIKNRKSKNAPPVLPAIVRPQDARRTVAVVVDDLGMSLESMGPVKKQLRKFVDEQILPNDLIAIIRTGGEVGALQQFTTDKRLLYRAIESLRRNPCSRVGTTVLGPIGNDPYSERQLRFPAQASPGIGPCAAESFNSTIQSLQFILKGMRDLPGRKSLVVLSDRVPLDSAPFDSLSQGPIRSTGGQWSTSGTQASITSNAYQPISAPGESLFNREAALRRVAELAIRTSVVIYAVDTSGIQVTGPTAADDYSAGGIGIGSRGVDGITSRMMATLSNRSHQLQDNRAGSDLIARETGGFLIHGTNNFGLPRVMEDQDGYYLIAYNPKASTFNRKFHHIKATVKRPGVQVRTRDGFFGVTDEQARPPLTYRDSLNMALMSPFGAVDIEVRLTALFANTPNVGSLLRSLVYFQPRDLTFTDEPDGWHKATFNLSGIIFGDNGRVVQRVGETRSVRLQGKEYDRVMKEGIVYQLDLPVSQPGAYQVRVAVRDETSARIGTAGQFVEIPDLKKDKLALSGITVSGGTPGNGDIAMADPANRRFRQNSNLFFGYAVYRSQLDQGTRAPNLLAQAKLFRDGQLVYDGQPKPIDLAGQTDLGRLSAGGGLQLGTLPPGEYILQLVVNDALGNEKNRMATQWIDFEITQ